MAPAAATAQRPFRSRVVGFKPHPPAAKTAPRQAMGGAIFALGNAAFLPSINMMTPKIGGFFVVFHAKCSSGVRKNPEKRHRNSGKENKCATSGRLLKR
ncbi:MAG TPA: hypothetical protein PLV61_12140 [Parvularculaceae bacterium]|nr:hypothetical protein [Parvularculaceae bacterium]HRX40535.1 hypothetical protein [Parvularculaceae bacterium]